jgi:hypothetical protein
MNLRSFGLQLKTGNAPTLRQSLTLVGGLLALPLLFAGTQANAAPVHFRYVGGRWGHAYHAGWHRYWGGPSIGFYYAPVPVYVVPGYAAPSYYTGSTFWYSNPSFGLNINLGGGGGYSGGRYYHGGGRPYGYHGPAYHGGGRPAPAFHGGGGRPAPAFHGGGGRPAQAFHGGGGHAPAMRGGGGGNHGGDHR